MKLFDRAVIVGVGLIGSSFTRALRENELAGAVVGYDLDAAVGRRAMACGAVEAIAATLEEAVAGADLVVIATPVGAARAVVSGVAAIAPDGALIIDVGSVKGAVVEAAAGLSSKAFIVPCHPVAGTEQSGPEAGFAALFRDRWSIITPLAREDEPYRMAVEKAAALWRDRKSVV